MTLATAVAGALGRPTTSFELFPPRTPAGADAVHDAVAQLADAGPDFFSVTYGAAGRTRASSSDLLCHVLATTPVTAVAHLTCVGASRADVLTTADALLASGVRNILALRGDPPAGQDDWRPHPDGIARACELVELLRVADVRHRVRRGSQLPADDPELSISVAAFPTGGDDDLAALRAKQDAGAAFAITQVVHEAADYAAFTARARAAGITIPLLPGIIPATDPGRLSRLESLTGVPVPRRVLAALESAGSTTERHRAGVALTADLARALLDVGAPGVHLYTFNRPGPALDVLDRADLLHTTPAPAAFPSSVLGG